VSDVQFNKKIDPDFFSQRELERSGH